MTDIDGEGVAGRPEKSEGQLLLDRALAQCNRFNRIRQKLEKIRFAIAPSKTARTPGQAPRAAPAPATSFFEALAMLADGNDQVADELEQTVEDLGALF